MSQLASDSKQGHILRISLFQYGEDFCQFLLASILILNEILVEDIERHCRLRLCLYVFGSLLPCFRSAQLVHFLMESRHLFILLVAFHHIVSQVIGLGRISEFVTAIHKNDLLHAVRENQVVGGQFICTATIGELAVLDSHRVDSFVSAGSVVNKQFALLQTVKFTFDGKLRTVISASDKQKRK